MSTRFHNAGTPDYNDPRHAFREHEFLDWIDEKLFVSNSFDPLAPSCGDIVTGILFQAGGGLGYVTTEQTGQFNELVVYTMPSRLAPAFKRNLNRLLKKIGDLKFNLLHEEANDAE